VGQDRLADVARRPLATGVPRRWAQSCTRPLCAAAQLRVAAAGEGRQPIYVARQLGHSPTVLLSTYAHLIEEYAERERVDAEAEIAMARTSECLQSASQRGLSP
jgi:hypothetical protein